MQSRSFFGGVCGEASLPSEAAASGGDGFTDCELPKIPHFSSGSGSGVSGASVVTAAATGPELCGVADAEGVNLAQISRVPPSTDRVPTRFARFFSGFGLAGCPLPRDEWSWPPAAASPEDTSAWEAWSSG